MMTRFFALNVQLLLTIFLIALCAYSMPAIAQNTSQKAEEMAEQNAERARILRERKELTQNLEKDRQACYQKLAVTPCLNEARDAHNEKMRDLKRQEVALNNAQRKRAAADRLQAIDERNSPEAQQKIAEQRGRALEAAERREASQKLRESSRAAKQAAAANKPNTSEPADGASTSTPKPQGNPRMQPKVKQAQTPDAAQIEHNRQQAAQREKDLAERRAKAQEREANRKKPAAKPLPIPN
jgi:colicin import membrane protein